MRRISIIGGGPGGLMTASLLPQQGLQDYQVTLFESSPRLGGKLAIRHFNKTRVLYESGAAQCYDYRLVGEDMFYNPVDELGLGIIDIAIHRWAGELSGQPGGFPMLDPTVSHQPNPEHNPDFLLGGDYLFDSTLNGTFRSASTATQLLIKRLNTPDQPVYSS